MTTALALRPPGGAATPASARFSSRRSLVRGFLTVAVLISGLLGWGALTTISGAVIATGRVGVETRDQVIEHIDGGTVGEILVRDGDQVMAGDVLVQFDDAALRSEAALLRGEWVALAARRNRLEAEFRGAAVIAWDRELVALARDQATTQAALEGERRLFEARHSSWAGQVAQLRERIGQTHRQIAGLESQAEAVERQSGFIARELDAQRHLFEQRLTQLDRLLELEREAARLDGQGGDIAARIAGARGRIAEIELQILQFGAARVEEAEAQAREVEAQENRARERLAEVERRLGDTAVRAPVGGEVHGMKVFAPGEVVRPGEPILHIVPAGAGLVVRAQLEPIDVDQVRTGQDAVLRFSAFSAHSTPEFEGHVLRVSADTVHDERSGLDWYEVELEIGQAIEEDPEHGIAAWPGRAAGMAVGWLPGDARRWLLDSGPEGLRKWLDSGSAPPPAHGSGSVPVHAHDLALAPGMPVEVYIRTEKRTPLSYLVKPLTDYFLRSMREE